MKKLVKSILFGTIACSAIALVGCGEAPTNHVVYNNTGDMTDWVLPAGSEDNMAETTEEENKVVEIKGNGGYLNCDQEKYAKYKTDKYDFVITYDIKPVSQSLEGAKIVGLDVGLHFAEEDPESLSTWNNAIVFFGDATGGKVKIGFGSAGTFTGDAIEVDGDTWYTVTVTVKTTKEAKTVSASVKDKATGQDVEGASIVRPYSSAGQNFETAEHIYANVYHGAKSENALAYLDNFKIVANKR